MAKVTEFLFSQRPCGLIIRIGKKVIVIDHAENHIVAPILVDEIADEGRVTDEVSRFIPDDDVEPCLIEFSRR
ncbi:hypothetical protein QFE97_15080 [Bacillus subtilis]|nr:hypothetical protein QFE97_15080 [Bacillus subtilis]